MMTGSVHPNISNALVKQTTLPQQTIIACLHHIVVVFIWTLERHSPPKVMPVSR
jgi:hypothetical protein